MIVSQSGDAAILGTWVPTWTGFSDNPTSVSATYIRIGKFCHVTLNGTAGTSNATTLTVTLPFTSKYTRPANSIGQGVDNGASAAAPARGDLAAASNVLTCFKDQAGTAWTGTGNKLLRLNLCYEAE